MLVGLTLASIPASDRENAVSLSLIENRKQLGLDCYDAIVRPRTKPKPGPAEVVNDCRFLKDENERLICFNRFVEDPARRVAPEKQAEPVAPKATSAAPKPVEPTER